VSRAKVETAARGNSRQAIQQSKSIRVIDSHREFDHADFFLLPAATYTRLISLSLKLGNDPDSRTTIGAGVGAPFQRGINIGTV
jgi:hypothetical protein